ncbi:MAG TPA: M15 family metallopeptidase [Burkholderiaceae bacterium]
MLILTIAAYFLLATALAALLCFPALRRPWHDAPRRAAVLARRLLTMRQSAAMAFVHGQMVWRAWSAQAVRVCYRHRLYLGGLAALGLAPALAIWLFARPATPAGYGYGDDSRNAHVAQLLDGEHLLPPAPLPPLLFTSGEAALERPLLASASRDWLQLDPLFTQKLLQVFKAMRERHGYEMALLEGYRSPERQRTLAAMGSAVTNAGAYQSYHQYGLASDCAFVRAGRLVISERDPWAMEGYRLYGMEAEAAGLRWGGRWAMRDYGHIELPRRGTLGTPP